MKPTRMPSGWYQVGQETYVPGVTTVLSASGLIPKRYFTVAARDRGTAVAELTAEWDRMPGTQFIDSCSNLRPYLSAWRAFVHASGAVFTGIEMVVRNREHGYAGRLDRLGVIAERECVIDIKTGALARWHGLQLAAYAGCLDGEQDRYGLYLSADGQFKIRKYADRSDWAQWLEILNEYKQRFDSPSTTVAVGG